MAKSRVELERTRKLVTVYVCPTPECDNFTAAPLDGSRLEEQWTGPKLENKVALQESSGSSYKHNRAECPTCRTYRRDIDGNPLLVQRIRLSVPINVPIVGPPTPSLPGSLAAGHGGRHT